MKTIICPSSKSYLQRAILCASLCSGTTVIKNVTLCDDVCSCLDAITAYGAVYKVLDNEIHISGLPFKRNEVVNVGESGTCCRMVIPILLCFNTYFTVQGRGTLNNRNISSIKDILDNDIMFDTNDDKLPVKLRGILKKYKYDIDGSATSQYISGMLIAKSFLSKPFNIRVTNCNSIGYVLLTVKVLSEFGVKIFFDCDDNTYTFYSHGFTKFHNTVIDCELDYSSLAAIYTAATILSNEPIIVNEVEDTEQPDKKMIIFGEEVQQNLIEKHGSIQISKVDKIKQFNVDISKTPDLFPYYATLAAFCDEYCCITGLDRLINKESNRGLAIYTEFVKFGIDCKIDGNSIYIKKGTFINTAHNSYNDHRIAMACMIIKKYYGCNVEYDGCLSKSYPDFLNMLNSL